jgi:ABC-type transport system involved in multi-copper enzyme maturation permease subunit
MPIREKGYYKWSGTLQNSRVRWLPIFFVGIKNIYRKKFSKLFFTSFASMFFIFLLALYASSKPELKMLSRLVSIIRTDNMLFRSFYTNGYMIFMSAILCLFAGSELISSDLKHNSVSLYLSRPLKKSDYIAGKYSIILFYLLLFSLLPGLLLIIFKVIFTGDISAGPSLLIKSFVFPIVISFFWSSLILMFSSLSENARFVKLVFFILYFFSDFIAKVFFNVFNNGRFLYLSIEKNIKQFGSFVFGTKAEFNAPEWISGLILISLTVVFITVLYFRMKKVEV